jgi:hypothetical protein
VWGTGAWLRIADFVRLLALIFRIITLPPVFLWSQLTLSRKPWYLKLYGFPEQFDGVADVGTSTRQLYYSFGYTQQPVNREAYTITPT